MKIKEGENIIIDNLPEGSEDYYISTTAKDNYEQLGNLPTINGVQIVGNLTTSDLGIVASGDSLTVNNYTDAINKPSINGVTLSGNVVSADLNISYNDLTNKPAYPVYTSQLSNDSNYVNTTDLATKQDTLTAGANISISSGTISAPNVYSKTEIDTLISNTIGGATNLNFVPVDTLPETGTAGTIYLVPNNSSESNNAYDEYLWYNNTFEKIAPVTPNISVKVDKITDNTKNYAYIHKINGNEDKIEFTDDKTSSTIMSRDSNGNSKVSTPTHTDHIANKGYVDNALSSKQDTLTVGDNISIVSGTISATDTTYTAGTNVTINNGVISATDTKNYNDLTNKPTIPSKTSQLTNDSGFLTQHQDISGKQDVLTAGSNITISDNTISATDTKYTSGTNISISSSNVISATDTKYTAGNNISISAQNEISATDTTYNAGNGVNISGGSISAKIKSGESVLSVDSNGLSIDQTKISYNNLTNKPTIPTKTSDLTNDSGFLTSSYHDNTKQNTLTAGTGISISNGTISTTISGLPSVTSSDNGKILQVVSGVWSAVTIQSADNESF